MKHLDKKYNMKDIFDMLNSTTKSFIIIDGLKIKKNSQRYKLFQNNAKCVYCGIEGSFFRITETFQDNKLSYHLNLFSFWDKKEILMTKDHIIPKSLGGTNTFDNYQTMCRLCNERKGNKI